ncbi:putative glyoxal oxidase precursor [Drechmeria coniospora]|uniref:Putative glyoxal oxidase n=1 Tax=Drechmeria coniospora TaxID=98403 RepID=A0A151GB59_DRECN|nr:putative glyoxal oxidase precursor [Drechmeria coniospora]KYK54338.1 putative glyoxal oxidase precursor [Drechmeria coniospora]
MKRSHISCASLVTLFSAFAHPHAAALQKRDLVAPAGFGNGWKYQGCFVDVGRTIDQAGTVDVKMTNEECVQYCFGKGFPYAGTEYHSQCFCGQKLATGGIKAADGDCSTSCGGNSTQPCGGPDRLTLYYSSQVKVPTVNPGADGWASIGCYSEGTTGRALAQGINAVPGAQMTVSKCTAACKASGYVIAGVEYGGECYCGNTIANGGKPTNSGCNMPCNGNSSEYCGGAGRLSMYSYRLGGGGGIDPGTSSTTSSVEPSTTETPPEQTGFPPGWSYYGCWVDGANGRILSYQTPNDPKRTLQSCVKTCADQGYTIAGAEYFTQCFCGKQIINNGVKAKSESECSTSCGGDAKQKCGGPGRMSIMSMGQPQVVGPPQIVPNVSDWAYQGCFQDNINQKRTFFWQNIFNNNDMTPEACVKKCGDFGYMAAGLEYGRECYCGDPANIKTAGAEKVSDKECNIPCSGNASALCGGGSRLTTYFWKGDPFYSWSFPEMGTPEAGSYDFLIGGVCIPLVTSQAINGKVTFLEKWGTGPPNSTGAYELDLSLVDNFKAAWRTMHVKTDIFCSGGVTLPDKAGRQLTVGGWSGESTFGIRMYTPDGSPGVPGRNDWEENVNVLKLQDGRWYPSTMNMANGSILVIGGEEGSNGAPVPTLEILPPTGTKPLFMDWLQRTNPNNLYPFVCVLPSGGIFVSYWNEARILDENTFATIKTLPNIPGAVNDPKGGRTYPLEGTAVLLPQRAPYRDPLGILICGGSTEGPANALDNCVSIYPDAPNPKWTLERMPSQRVMSCIAPLPDGTYLILNGARHGVAGFGLGKNPNLNALLYDPSKAVGHRITVMANTTVARMYHSEAITLLDGRVLVSGSDPQDGINPQEYRVETFTPPYLLKNKPRPTFNLSSTDWSYGQKVTLTVGNAAGKGLITASLLGSVSSTHGNSMGARTLFPEISCVGVTCTVTAPPGKYIAPPGWYQFFVLNDGIPAVGRFVRIGGDPAGVGNWPKGNGFTPPGI